MRFWNGDLREASSCARAFATWTPEPVRPSPSGPDDTSTDLRTLGRVLWFLSISSCVCPAPRRPPQPYVSASLIFISFSKFLCFMDKISSLCGRILVSLRRSAPWRAFCRAWVHPHCCPSHVVCPLACPTPAGVSPYLPVTLPARPPAGLSPCLPVRPPPVCPSFLPWSGGGARWGWGLEAPPFGWGLSPRLPSRELWVSSCLLALSPVLQVLLLPLGLLSTTSAVTQQRFWREW